MVVKANERIMAVDREATASGSTGKAGKRGNPQEIHLRGAGGGHPFSPPGQGVELKVRPPGQGGGSRPRVDVRTDRFDRQASNTQAPLTLRVNLRAISLAAYLQALADAGIAARSRAPACVYLDQPVPVVRLPGYAQGWFSVQDAAAQRAAYLLLDGLALDASSRVLDACAAPGGKTGHLLEITPARVVALEQDPARTARIHANLQRLNLQAEVITGDAGEPAAWWDGQAFDAILLDAPCTASGIVRRHPDIRWLRRESDIAQLARSQQRLLEALWPLLRIGGRLLYCTCSIFAQEGPLQLQAFLARHGDAHAMPADGSLWPQSAVPGAAVLDNAAYDHDGFFYGLLEKRAA